MRPSMMGRGTPLALLMVTLMGSTPVGPVQPSRQGAALLTTPDPGQGEHWSVAPAAILDIGAADGAEAFLFSRVIHAGTLPSGALVVADRGTLDLRLFDSAGRLIRRIGRRGSGPAEFQQLTWVGVDRSGAIVAYDDALRRVSRFTWDGTFDKVFPVPPLPGVPYGSVIAQLGDGSLLVSSLLGLPTDADLAKLSTGIVRDSIGLSLVSRDGTSRTLVGRFPGSQFIRAVGPPWIVMDPAPFGLRTMIAAADTVFFVGTQETYAIGVFRPDGSLLRVIRRAVPPAPVTAQAKAESRRRWDERLERIRAKGPVSPQIAAIAKNQVYPDAFPAYGRLLADRAGNVWVEQYRPFPQKGAPSRWTVFTPDGTIRATAELPDIEITEIGADRVVGVWLDPDDVPHVRVYRLVKRK